MPRWRAPCRIGCERARAGSRPCRSRSPPSPRSAAARARSRRAARASGSPSRSPRDFAVGAHHLLRVGDDARLHRGRPRRDRAPRRRVSTPRSSSCAQHRAGRRRRRRPRPTSIGFGAERAQVRSDVAGAAERAALALDLDHRNRRLGRDAVDAAPQVAVEHQVAEHQQAATREACDQRVKAGRVGGRSRRLGGRNGLGIHRRGTLAPGFREGNERRDQRPKSNRWRHHTATARPSWSAGK